MAHYKIKEKEQEKHKAVDKGKQIAKPIKDKKTTKDDDEVVKRL